MGDREQSELWACPQCGKQFVTANTFHSCGNHSIEEFMAGKSEVAWAYWDRLNQMVGTCGPYTVVANKTRLVFMVRVRFAGITAVSDRGMSMSFWLKEQIASPRFRRVDHYTKSDFGHHLRVASLAELDDELQEWLCRSYEVGCQRA